MYVVQCDDGRFYRRGKLVQSREAASFGWSPSGAAGILERARKAFPEMEWKAVPFRENVGMAQTSKEKQEAFRARQAMLGNTEVRGIFAPPALHAAIKEAARKQVGKHKPEATDASIYRCVKCGYKGLLQVNHERPNGSGECGYIASRILPAEKP